MKTEKTKKKLMFKKVKIAQLGKENIDAIKGKGVITTEITRIGPPCVSSPQCL